MHKVRLKHKYVRNSVKNKYAWNLNNINGYIENKIFVSILIRDSAISLYDQRKAMEDLQPIPLIKAFLMKYVDEAEFQRRQSHTEDDNPPSPQNIPDESGMKFPIPHTPPTANAQQPHKLINLIKANKTIISNTFCQNLVLSPS